ncbi:hypothetical protein AWH56_012040 [Anaerobacillus isosaccharinicus]|uniref:Uncharacterized protein n=1 Tax=Anaerobacillus isosaccharinicus TaxID=1532552 RepID=A0A7S7RDM7_9BACI|nr:hypothetical protein [Anaerobacillus isosaccharinicus]MBA5588370.1 hypothetical protein [Anaerobacillus isosaccharinicus]QOY38197.1 hypothetical protein AWH56_012040 [Anaerobacillus isosaccharinicus]
MTNNYYLLKVEADFRQQQISAEMTKVGNKKARSILNLFNRLFEKQPKSCCQTACCSA